MPPKQSITASPFIRSGKVSTITLLFLLLQTVTAFSATWFVATKGLDSGHTGASNSPFTVNVTMVISPPAVSPNIASVLNAASNQPTAVSPGLLVAIFGTSIGPAVPVNLRLTAAGTVDTFIGDTRVLFDGIAAPLVYVSSGQVNAIVPYAVTGRVTVAVQIEYLGVRSAPIQLRVVDSAPAIFTIPATGSGQGAILNQNGTVNNFSNPAAKGSVVVIYMTGEGQTNPGGADGTITGTAILKRPQLPVTVTVGGIPAAVQYAGAAPFIVSGVMQVNIQLPDNVPAGSIPVVVTVGSAASQANVTVAVQ